MQVSEKRLGCFALSHTHRARGGRVVFPKSQTEVLYSRLQGTCMADKDCFKATSGTGECAGPVGLSSSVQVTGCSRTRLGQGTLGIKAGSDSH